MTFTTPSFILFLAAVYLLYWTLERRGQNLLLLLSSLVFYGAWDWRFLFLLLLTAGIDYLTALAMPEAGIRRRRFLLGVSLVTNLGILGLFKYFNFFSESLQTLLAGLGMSASPFTLRLILPVGISFFTFQALSYTIDVYRGTLPPVRDFVAYFSFISFFPHMVAGPIQQAKHFLVQFNRDRHFNRDQAVDGLRQMLWGFFKKMVVADNLAPFVNQAYGAAGEASGWTLLWATYLFAFQIYCDFSGYTDIAIGCARLFDLHMTRNFAYPYFARSVPDFWRRWHITLSNWFRDYLYIPLGGNRVSERRRSFNVFVVFLVSGFWHGANWTYVIWGGLHGFYFLASAAAAKAAARLGLRPEAWSPLQRRIAALVAIAVTFNLVCIAWVFFRADSVGQATLILTKIGQALASGHFERPPLRAVALIGVLLFVEGLQRHRPHGFALDHWRPWPRRAVYGATAAAILLLANLNHTPFIYFQF